ncbi:MAG: hypothetical protein K940chlam2_01599 [Chlamydiae bacterium]|nr:hypothetical protein [Chlamydiota bacterium]
MIDWLLANPGQSMAVLADNMNVSRSWLSIVMHSDVFVEKYTIARMSHTKNLSRQLIEKQLKVTLKAYDALELIIDDNEVDDRLVLDAADKTARLLQFTPTGGNSPKLLSKETTIEKESIREVSPGVIERARERMRETTHMSFYGNQDALPSPEG